MGDHPCPQSFLQNPQSEVSSKQRSHLLEDGLVVRIERDPPVHHLPFGRQFQATGRLLWLVSMQVLQGQTACVYAVLWILRLQEPEQYCVSPMASSLDDTGLPALGA